MSEYQKTIDEEKSVQERLKEREENNKSHDSKENSPIVEKEYISDCGECGQFLGMNASSLTYEEREKFNCGWKVIKYKGKFLCPYCLITLLWQDGIREIKEDKMDKELTVKEAIVMPAVTKEKAVEAFNAYQDLAKEIIRPEDIQKIQGKDFKKKSFWRKCQRFFNLSIEKIEERREEHNGSFSYHFIFRAIAPNGAFMDGTGSCSSDEKGFLKTEHNTRAIAETRAKNRAIADLVAFGEVSAEEIIPENEEETSLEPKACLTIPQAKEKKKGETFNLMGIVTNAEEYQNKNKVWVAKYYITDNEDNKMIISNYGHVISDLKENDTVVFGDVTVYEFKGENSYLAKTIEKIK